MNPIEVVSLTARCLLLQNKPAEYRATLAERLEERGLALDSASALKTSILLRPVKPGWSQ